ncbi:MAG: FecR family protein [Desulfovibrionaceae bacterium]
MRRFIILVFLCLLGAGNVFAEEFIGSIKHAQGESYLVHQGQAQTAQVGDHLYKGDVLRTGDGSLGALFRDDTAISLGPESEIAVEEFIFDPAGGNLSFLTKIFRGSAAFLTGQMGKIRPEAFRVETPQATIGIRGTHFVVDVD